MFPLKKYLRLYEKYHQGIISKHAPKYFDGLHPKNHFHYRSEFFIENLNSEDVVVDIACGTGLILSNIAPHVKKAFGIENHPENLKHCLEKHQKSNLEFIDKNLFDINYDLFKKETGYNTVIISHILEHIEDAVGFLKRIKADKLLICVPSQENWYRQLLIYFDLPYMTDATHFREYTREMLRSELLNAGYEVISMGFNAEGEIICRAEFKN